MRLVIVGGVAAGMSCAARARRLDETAQIIVLERGEFVSYASCGLPYYVSGEIADQASLSVQTPESLKAALNLDVRTGHDVIGLDPQAKTVTVRVGGETHKIAYDELVLAPGAVAARPPIPGLDSPRVRTLRTVPDALALREMTAEAERAVVLGAGFIGLEVAEALNRAGLRTAVVEMAPHVLPPLEAELARLVADELDRLGISVHTGVAARAIVAQPCCEAVMLSDGAQVEADLVVVAVGVRPDTGVFEAAGVACDRGMILADDHGATNLPHVWAAGDAVMQADGVTGARRPIPLAGPANRAGRLVADAIFAPESARPIPASLGTAIVRIGDLTAAMTGANRASLDAAGIAYDTIHLHPNDHAGYFPGAQPMHLVVHVEQGTGRLLGAQGVGQAGVDRRIDVLATAIRGGMTASDLIDLDLAYSPPYGQAKDAVTMIGLVGENLATGTIALWHADQVREVLDTCLVVDTRTPREFATGHLPGALNIAHTELRERLDEVRAAAQGRPVRVMCASGFRSYLAHRILVAAGFDSATLSGGMQTLRASLSGDDEGLLE